MSDFDPIGNTIARIISHIARQATEERAVELLMQTATGLRKKFPITLLKTARLVLDLAINGDPDALNKTDIIKTNKQTAKTKSRKTSREL